MIDNSLKQPSHPLENEWPSDDAAFKTNNQCILSMCNVGQIFRHNAWKQKYILFGEKKNIFH